MATLTQADLTARAKAIGRRNPDYYRSWPRTHVLRELVNREWAAGDLARLRRLVTGDLLAALADYRLDGELFAIAVEAAHRPTHRPRQDPTAARVVTSYRLHPATIAAIVREALRTKSSAGQVVDRLAGGLAVRDSSAT